MRASRAMRSAVGVTRAGNAHEPLRRGGVEEDVHRVCAMATRENYDPGAQCEQRARQSTDLGLLRTHRLRCIRGLLRCAQSLLTCARVALAGGREPSEERASLGEIGCED